VSAVSEAEVISALRRVSSILQGNNLVDAGMVKQVEIAGGEVKVKLQRPRDCVCGYAFVLAVLAEKEIRKLEGVEKASVEVVL
jgi:metal-sulfur cluster biosynthetic enzyme